jgi:hypothetical protein
MTAMTAYSGTEFVTAVKSTIIQSPVTNKMYYLLTLLFEIL